MMSPVTAIEHFGRLLGPNRTRVCQPWSYSESCSLQHVRTWSWERRARANDDFGEGMISLLAPVEQSFLVIVLTGSTNA